MNPKKTLFVVVGLLAAWAWWSMVLDDRRGDVDEATQAEADVRSARAGIFVPTMTEDEALAVIAEADTLLVFYGDPTHPDRAEARSRHVRSAILALLDESAPDACAPSISDAGAVPGPHNSEIIPLTVSLTVPDTAATRSFLIALTGHPSILLQSFSVEAFAGDDGGVESDVVTCAGFLVQVSFDLYGRSAPPPIPPPEDEVDG